MTDSNKTREFGRRSQRGHTPQSDGDAGGCTGTSKSAAAAQAAMKAYDEQIASGLSVEDASLAARRILHASLTGLQGGP